MRFGIYTLDDADIRGKTILARVDINQPIDRVNNTLKDTTRVRVRADHPRDGR